MARDPAETIASFAGKPFADVAVEVIHPFMGGAISRDELRRMAARRLRPLRPSGGDAAGASYGPAVAILELFHGPTLAFKDVAMQLLARLMDRVLGERGERATIVGATSGDTGGAAIEAFRGFEARRRVDPVSRRAASRTCSGA